MNRKANDESLISRIKEGDAEALEYLVKAYLPKTYNRVRSLIPESDAEDVTQEIFVAMLHSVERFDGKSAFSTWFYRIIMNKVADYYRQSRRRQNAEKSEAANNADNKIIAADPWPKDEDVDEIALKKAILEVSDQDREIILLRLSDDLSFYEIATKMGLTYEATRSRYRRAVRLIKEKIKNRFNQS